MGELIVLTPDHSLSIYFFTRFLEGKRRLLNLMSIGGEGGGGLF